MEPIFDEFRQDLHRVAAQLDLLEKTKEFVGVESSGESGSRFIESATKVYEAARTAHAGMPLLTGTLVLYIAGRLEAFTRTIFEDLCLRLVERAASFKALPKKMQENLVVYTALVMQSPRKYGHAENGVRTFATTLADNLNNSAGIDRVNHECLSITETNLRPDVLAELFERVGVKEIWKKIAQQAPLQIYFQTQEVGSVESLAKRKLTELMDLRNKVAHPSGSIEWPSTDIVRTYIAFLEVLGKALSDLVGVFEVTLCQMEPSPAPTPMTL